MPIVEEAWREVLPRVREAVTGVGVWTALNLSKPIALEGDVFVLGLPHGNSELAGHLRVMATKKAIETLVSEKVGTPVLLRVIDGESSEDWEAQKRKDEQARKLQDQALQKMRSEMSARHNWDGVYEQLSRRYAAIQNKSLPQNRARFFAEAVELVVQARKSQEGWDEMGERNFARCLERIAQYTDLPTTLVATQVLQRAGEL